MTLAHRERRPSRAVTAFLAASGRTGVPLDVDDRDEMLGHLLRAHHGSAEAALVGYFRTGLMAARALERVLDWRFGERRPIRLLDFAGGYGRVSRFFAADRDRLRLAVADIDAEAVDWQRRGFGIEGLVTSGSPDRLEVEGRFEAVFAASFFSHLPETRFGPWLERLLGLLAPGGVLVASTHGAETLPPGRTMPAGGLYFEEVSETGRLALSDYGSTWITEERMDRELAAASAGGASWRRFPRALWHSQDLFVAVPESGADLSGLELSAGPRGYLDHCHLESPRRLVIGGWAVDSAKAGQAVRVAVAVEDAPLGTVETSRPRPDASAELGAAADAAGWELVAEVEAELSPTDLLVVAAESESGSAVLHAGTLEGTALYLDLVRSHRDRERLRDERDRGRTELGGLRQALADESRRVAELDAAVHRLGWEKAVLEERVAAMRQSRFWKLRGAWRALTGRGGR